MADSSGDEDMSNNSSSGDEGGEGGGRDLEQNLERTKERVKGLKETVSHLEAFITNAKKYSADKDEEIAKLKQTIAELEAKRKGGPPSKGNGRGDMAAK